MSTTPSLTCPLCSFEFHRSDARCDDGCPFAARCNLVRCPSCAFEFPGPSRAASLVARVLGMGVRVAPPAAVRTLNRLAPGERAAVVAVGPEGRGNATLATFGLVPGAEVTLVQHRPACVLRVGETEIAVDREIAEQILLGPASAAGAPCAG